MVGSPRDAVVIRPELFGRGRLDQCRGRKEYKCAMMSLRFRREEHALLS